MMEDRDDLDMLVRVFFKMVEEIDAHEVELIVDAALQNAGAKPYSEDMAA